ncbi:hypothetical protein BDQ17DRAFT_1333783 [Cyathus striatus]|nr:hypothetical protein BDQ17DRAFT_1333783 [Cyathus striatus]
MIFSLPLSNMMLEHVKELPLLIIPRFRFIPTVHLNIVEFPAQEIVQIEPLIEGPSPDIKSLTLVLLDRWSVKSITDTLSTRLGKLKKLTMDLSTCILDGLKDVDFLKHCNSLTTLELLARSMLLYYPRKIDLSMLPHLRSIKLATDFARRGEPSCILYNLGQCLRTASANNEIKEIVLGPSCDLYHVIMKPGPDQWKELDMLLSGPQFGKLEEFYRDALCRKMPMGALNENLSRTYERGIIRVVEVNEPEDQWDYGNSALSICMRQIRKIYRGHIFLRKESFNGSTCPHRTVSPNTWMLNCPWSASSSLDEIPTASKRSSIEPVEVEHSARSFDYATTVPISQADEEAEVVGLVSVILDASNTKVDSRAQLGIHVVTA